MTISSLTERDLVARIQSRLPPAPSWLAVGIGDDAAVVEPERNRLDVLTVDASVEGIHFDRRWSPPGAIGHRALAVNLSDLAAMGAAPRSALLSLVLPTALPCDEFDGIIDGIATLAAAHHVHVIGGNLTRSPGPLMLDITAIGTVKRRQTLVRSGAMPGDEIYVTGTIGAAGAGLQMLQQATAPLDAATNPCVQRYLYPVPRVRAGMIVARNRAASACIDLSDGFADGIQRVTTASGVGATIDFTTIPFEPAALAWTDTDAHNPGTSLLTLGDDYELLFTVTPRARRRFLAAARAAGVTVTRVGVCTKERDLQFVNAPAETATFPEGFSHFR
ncbi:MAG: thiamine-phosphate kinase [Acidobacteriaceae bacterium]|nr:thiamine-phosphate kinase [Acidobacteriaceae bacterium]